MNVFVNTDYNLYLYSRHVCASCHAKDDWPPPGVSDERVDLGCLTADRVLMCLRFAALSPFQSHLESCQFATVPCPQCQRSVRKSSVELHVTVECQRRPVSCPDCFTGFVYEEREVSPSPAVRQRGIWSPHSGVSLWVFFISSISSSVPLPA